MTSLVTPPGTGSSGTRRSGSRAAARPRHRIALAAGRGVGLLPFTVYVLLFLAIPTVIALVSGFQDGDGNLTLDNLSALTDPTILRTIGSSLWLAALTSLLGAIIGALVCFAMMGLDENRLLSRIVTSISSVLAQFGGVMLAFAFIATIGIQGAITVFLRGDLGIDIYKNGVWLYELPGLILPYLYFQVPLMVIVFLPAMKTLKVQWAEANLTLGGTRLTFWTRIGFPLLLPSFVGSFLLLFTNGFSAYSTAAALINQASPIVPLQIRLALSSETVLGRENVAGVLALAMMVIMSVAMALYALVQKRAARWRL
ncbi:ABC transporter permease [Mycetocola lacteus]|uniref:ABC transporter permease n=1 Tax=Mycetocola lacteus TaxID=76637 RepID=UPI001FE3A189|nr:ABC transporter permease [Mycetocola lacteus]